MSEEKRIWLKIALPMFLFCCCLLAIIFIIVNGFSNKNKTANTNNASAPEYTEYLDWNGYYTGGWMDNGILLELHPDYDFGAKCGTLENDFRGNKSFGRIYYMGDSVFTFQIFNADGSFDSYLVKPQQNQENIYTLDIYTMDGKYDCTFTKEFTLEEYSKEYDLYMK